MSAKPKPVLGAALSINSLPAHREWLLSRQRDLELQDFFRAEVLDGDWRSVADRVKRQLDGFEGRLGIHGPFWGFKIDSHDPLVRHAVRTRLLQGLEAAETVGATQMVIHSPYHDLGPQQSRSLSRQSRGRDRAGAGDLVDVIRRAEQIGCELVIENIEDKDPHERVHLAKALNSKNVRVSIDTGHALYAHISTGAPPVDYYVDAAGDMLTHVHLQDTDGYADRHWAPGDGTMRWAAIFRALGRLRSNPRLILELRDHARCRRREVSDRAWRRRVAVRRAHVSR